MTIGIKFWGVRGSIACPSPTHIKYGGNTSCLEVIVGDHHFILDAGTGIRNLGQEFSKRGIKKSTLLLTHTHWDHINGFPFFQPAFAPGNSLHIMAGHLGDKGGVHEIIASQMANPMFPVPLEAMQADINFEDFVAGDAFNLSPEVKIRTAPLNHPNGATGYRIEFAGKSFCYITDTEHLPGELDQNILGLIEGADLVAYDSTYTEEEFPDRVGWGHSTWNQGLKLCKEAGVKQFAVFHHDPDHDDDFMADIESQVKEAWPNSFVARDNMEVEID